MTTKNRTATEVSPKKNIVGDLRYELKNDADYYIAWKANIAMAFYDEARRKKVKISRKNLHEISNTAADNFLQLLIKDSSDE